MSDPIKKTIEESSIHHQDLRKLTELESDFIKSLNTKNVLKAIVDATTKLLDVEHCSITLFDPEIGGTIGRARVNVQKSSQTRSSDKISELAIPLKINENIIGVLNVESSRQRMYTDDEKELLNLLASQAAIAIQNAKLFEESKKRSNTTLIEFDLEQSAFSVNLSIEVLLNEIVPYIKAISQLQEIIDEILGHDFGQIRIRSISQNSPISVSLVGAADAIQLIRDIITPWRNKHLKELASLLEREKLFEIECKKAEVLERHALAEKSRNEAKRISLEMEKQREEVARMKLENERIRIELHREKIKLALEVLNHISPHLSETDKIAYVVKILQPLDILLMSNIAISLENKK
jgi:hypothetical protein